MYTAEEIRPDNELNGVINKLHKPIQTQRSVLEPIRSRANSPFNNLLSL